MEAGAEPRSLYLDSGTGGMGTHARTQGHGDRDLQTHTHGRHVDTGPNQSHTDIGTDKGFETQRHGYRCRQEQTPPGSCTSQMGRALIFVSPLKIPPRNST